MSWSIGPIRAETKTRAKEIIAEAFMPDCIKSYMTFAVEAYPEEDTMIIIHGYGHLVAVSVNYDGKSYDVTTAWLEVKKAPLPESAA